MGYCSLCYEFIDLHAHCAAVWDSANVITRSLWGIHTRTHAHHRDVHSIHHWFCCSYVGLLNQHKMHIGACTKFSHTATHPQLSIMKFQIQILRLYIYKCVYIIYTHTHAHNNACAKIPGKLLWCDPACDCNCGVFKCVFASMMVPIAPSRSAYIDTFTYTRTLHTRFAIMMILIAPPRRRTCCI